jgi:hypothetical protein
MRNAVLISAGLHVAAIALTVAGLPSLFDSKRIEVVPISVELVTFTEEEKTAPDPKPKPEPRLDPPPPPPATAEPPPPEPVAEPVPEPSPPEPAPKPVIEAKPKPKPKPMLKLLARKVVVPQPRTKPAPPPDAFQKLLKNLNQERKHEDDERKRAQEKAIALVPPSPPVQPAPRPPSPIEQRMLAATLSQEVMRQVSLCWSPPAGVKDAHTIRVGVRIFLKPDGHLSGPPQVEDSKRMRSDFAFRAVAESALRALRNPRCSPLQLPLKSFETWREISFNFDPRELLR